MKYVKAQDMYWDVIKDHGDTVEISAHGGGFVFKVEKSLVELVDSIPDSTIDCYAVIDDFMGPYKCKADPQDRWNGWAKPRFDDQVIRQILKDCGDLTVLKWYDSEILVTASHDEEPWSIWKDKDGLWNIDGWTWDIQDAQGRYISRDGKVSQD